MLEVFEVEHGGTRLGVEFEVVVEEQRILSVLLDGSWIFCGCLSMYSQWRATRHCCHCGDGGDDDIAENS